MVASSSTRHIGDLSRQLHAARHGGDQALVYSNHLKEAVASTRLAIILGRFASGVPWFLHSTVVPMRCQLAVVETQITG